MGTVHPFHYAAFHFSKYLYTCLGLDIVPELSSKVSPAPTVRILIHPLGNAGPEEGCSRDVGDPGAQTQPVFFPCASFHWVIAHKEGEIIRHMVLPPPFPSHAFRTGRGGDPGGLRGNCSSVKAKMSPSAVSSLLQSTFPTEKVGSVCEDVTSLEELQIHPVHSNQGIRSRR